MDFDIPLSRSIIFPILVTMMIPSIICSLFILYHFARSRGLRKKLHNHVVFILLLTNFIQVITDMPLALVLLRTGFVLVQTDIFCLFWSVYNYAITVIGLFCMVYGCIERYCLVFHRVFFKKHLILLHYGPLVFCLIYPPLLYIGLIVIYPCENYFDYTQFTCGGVCYQYKFGLGLYDWFCNVCTPVIIGTIATIVLIVRVLVQKRRMRRGAIWQRNRKMVLQLVTISIMYIVVWIPNVVGFVIPIISPNPSALVLASHLLIYSEYIGCLLCPFMCLMGLPEIRTSIKQLFTRRNIVQPAVRNVEQFVTPLPQRQFTQNRNI